MVINMSKIFNINGACKPKIHYMVDLTTRLEEIKIMIDKGQYFTINRARQYGKTTTLRLLVNFLKKDYEVVSLDFQKISFLAFESEKDFVATFSEELLDCGINFPENIEKKLLAFVEGTARLNSLYALFKALKLWFKVSEKKIVLIIDEVDTATNNQVFCDFLSQLRAAYLDSDVNPTFQSVILAGVYDVRNVRRKIRPEDEHKMNSPWNIATEFNIDMSFSEQEIEIMLKEYKEDHQINIDANQMAELLYSYTSGYPYLVSKLCKLLDEEISNNRGSKTLAWTKTGFHDAVRIILSEKNTLFESLIGKLINYQKLNRILYNLLFVGKSIPYNLDEQVIDIATMFGFVKNQNGIVAIANRIFETRLYNFYLSSIEMQQQDIYTASLHDKSQFVVNGKLDMKYILERFVIHFNELYGNRDTAFVEEEGRRYFLLYLRPIINGIGNYYIEARTRDLKRTDVIVDYNGEQYIIEMKIWHGKEYNSRGEKQLYEYLEYYHKDKGYLLSFNFNKKKEIGIKEIQLEDKIIIEAVV